MKRVNTDVMDKFEAQCCKCIHCCPCDDGIYYCKAGRYAWNNYDIFFSFHTKKPNDCDSYKRKI